MGGLRCFPLGVSHHIPAGLHALPEGLSLTFSLSPADFQDIPKDKEERPRGVGWLYIVLPIGKPTGQPSLCSLTSLLSLLFSQEWGVPAMCPVITVLPFLASFNKSS